jgi:tryptophan 2,3-dioxygenase
MKYDPIYYGEYLKLDKLLDAQDLMSEKYGKPAHDETLFIIIHQTYELWFKQILHEIDSIHALFSKEKLAPTALATISHRLRRITEIQKILNDQLNVIETMSPLDFMEFRDYLVPASGFQSIQFRMIELKLGLRQEYRLHADKAFFNSRLKPEDKEFMLKLEEGTTLLELIDNWLSRLPFGKRANFDFWEHYQEKVDEILKSDEEIIRNNKTLNEKQIEFEINNLNATRETFSVLFDENKYQALKEKGEVRISREAKLALIFIKLFKDEPILQMPNQILDLLIDIDELFTTWRYRHAIMAHRMLGRKIGTGGSSGHDYLKKSTENNRVFTDLFNVATFLIPKSSVPTLPSDIKKDLSFNYE